MHINFSEETAASMQHTKWHDIPAHSNLHKMKIPILSGHVSRMLYFKLYTMDKI